ncbi:MAG: hypothetical protein ABI790_06390 [Betaproteobacteria bacterium]
MNSTYLHRRALLATAMLVVATAGMAEAPPRRSVSTSITPEIVQQAALAAQSPAEQSIRLPDDRPAYDLFHDTSRQPDHLPNACTQKSGSLCFDYRTGHAMYKPMRRLLPAIPGMTPHNLSIRRNRIVAEYRFK